MAFWALGSSWVLGLRGFRVLGLLRLLGTGVLLWASGLQGVGLKGLCGFEGVAVVY